MSDIEVRPVKEWFNSTDVGVKFRCPVEGEPLDPDAPPTFLYNSDELWNGQQVYSQGDLRHVVIGAWVTAGETQASQLDGRDGYDFEQTVDEAQAVGYVYPGLHADLEDERLKMAGEAVRGGQLPMSTGSDYLDRITLAVARARVPVFYAGVDTAPDPQMLGPVDQAMAEMRNQVDRLAAEPATRGKAADAEILVRNIEQWYSALRIGTLLCGIALIAQEEGSVLASSMVVMPPSHLDMLRKLKVLGIDRVDPIFRQPALSDEYVLADARYMRYGYIPSDEL